MLLLETGFNIGDEWAIWLAPAAALVVSFGMAGLGYFALKRKRLMQNVPTSKVKGVFIGLNELKGVSRIESPLTSHLAQTPCVWYSYKVEEHWERTETTTDSEGETKTERRSGWETIDDGEHRKAFRLEDDTGEIRVLPTKAKFIGDRVFSETVYRRDDLYFGKGPRMELSGSTGRRKFTEHAVGAGDDIYLLGSARVREDVVQLEIAHDPLDKLFLISSKDEATLTLRYSLMSFFSFLGGLLLIPFFPPALGMAIKNHGTEGLEFNVLFMVLAALLYGLVVAGMYFSLIYNGLVSVMNRVERAWSLIEVQLQRRFDLIPRLVECTKGYMEHEAEVHKSVAAMRSSGMTGGQAKIPSGDVVASQAAATNSQTAVLGKMLALAEGYPELKANTVFEKLNEELVDTEDRISLSRSFFNDSVTAYNDRIQKLPDVVFAMIFKYKAASLYQIQEFERAAVTVDLHDDEAETEGS